MSPRLKKYFNKKIDQLVFWLLIKMLRRWVNHHMDQWEKWKFDTNHREVYVTISYVDQYPESFDRIK
jgi:hypothetical protein